MLAGLLISKIIKILRMDLNLDTKCVLIKAILKYLVAPVDLRRSTKILLRFVWE